MRARFAVLACAFGQRSTLSNSVFRPRGSFTTRASGPGTRVRRVWRQWIQTRYELSARPTSALLACLGAQAGADRFYAELDEHGDDLLPFLDDVLRLRPIQELLDMRIAAFVGRHANAGTDALLESLCWMVSKVGGPGVDPLLTRLFHRWVRRFQPTVASPQHTSNPPLWRAFHSLAHHPRFRSIPNYDLRLVELLNLNIPWYHKNELVDAIAKSPRSYVRLETLLLRAAPYEHFARDDVDRLDDPADELFRAVREPDERDQRPAG